MGPAPTRSIHLVSLQWSGALPSRLLNSSRFLMSSRARTRRVKEPVFECRFELERGVCEIYVTAHQWRGAPLFVAVAYAAERPEEPLRVVHTYDRRLLLVFRADASDAAEVMVQLLERRYGLRVSGPLEVQAGPEPVTA